MAPVVGMHKDEIHAAIEAAGIDELKDIDLTLAELGYDAKGVARTRIGLDGKDIGPDWTQLTAALAATT